MMESRTSTDETVVVGVYTNRPDAEVAKAWLAEHGIYALIVADNTHSSFQFTEGVRLRVFEQEAEHAQEILSQASESPRDPASSNVTALEEGAAMEGVGDGDEHVDEENLTMASGSWVGATAWTYVAAFVLMVAIILTGLLVG